MVLGLPVLFLAAGFAMITPSVRSRSLQTHESESVVSEKPSSELSSPSSRAPPSQMLHDQRRLFEGKEGSSSCFQLAEHIRCMNLSARDGQRQESFLQISG